MALTNDTFVQLEHFAILVNSLEKTLKAVANLTDMGDTLTELQSIMSSDVMKVAIKSMGGGSFEGILKINLKCERAFSVFKNIVVA